MAKESSKTPVKTETASRHPVVGLRDEIDQVFNNFMRGFGSLSAFDPFRDMHSSFSLPRMDLSPDIDVSETDGSYEISAELPGLEDKDIELTLKDDILTLKGEKKAEREEKDKNRHLSERSYGMFQRSFRVPNDVDLNKINTAFAKGVLIITLPKSKEAKAEVRKIEVKTS